MASLRRFTHGFLGWNGVGLRIPFREGVIRAYTETTFTAVSLTVLTGLAIALLLPNSAALLRWGPQKKLCLAVGLSVLALLGILLPEATPEFIYSNF